MINLLPPAAKRTMKHEYWMRVGVVWLGLLTAVLIVTMILLVPSFVLVQVQLRAYAAQILSATQAAQEQDALTNIVREANTQATAVLDFSAVDPFSRYNERIRELQGSLITINQLSFKRSETRVESVTVTGIASDRGSLTAFSAALTDDPLFTDAKVPLANLAADEDIGFSITITVAEQS